MGKFSDYVGTIKQQTDDLREVVTAKSGVDCSKMSISGCAGVVDNLEVTSQEEARYVRPSWYPDIEAIVKSAPDIVKDGKTYYPVIGVILYANEVVTHFNQTSSTSSSSGPHKYMNATGCDAYIFSDVVNNDISNANENTLQVGTGIAHTWDMSKDISNVGEDYSIRWAIFYATSLTSNISCSIRGYFPSVEVVVYQGTFSNFLLGSGFSSDKYYTGSLLKYVKCCKEIKNDFVMANRFLVDAGGLEEFVTEKPIDVRSGSLTYCVSLKRIIHEGVRIYSDNDSNIGYLYKFNNFVINDEFDINVSPVSTSGVELVTINKKAITNLPSPVYLGKFYLVDTENISGNLLPNLKNACEVKIPSTLQSWTGTTAANLYSIPYVELFNDFEVSGVNFTGGFSKSLKWLKDLCVWLKDRTGDTANTMIIGTANLNNANNIYLTFNPNDKRDITFDGVTAETEGAVSITEFITENLNWTLS